MSLETIGKAIGLGDVSQPDEGVAFALPYGETTYAITLSNAELDVMLQKGFQKLLGNRAISGFDFSVELAGNDLPLYIGAVSIGMQPNPKGIHDVDMEVGVATMSGVNEHRGTLSSHRRGWDGKWSFINYFISPALKDCPEKLEY